MIDELARRQLVALTKRVRELEAAAAPPSVQADPEDRDSVYTPSKEHSD